MIAKLRQREITLDYTDIAKPLTTQNILDDITEVQAKSFDEPGEIVMWEQQWDWLVKVLGFERRCDGGDTYGLYGETVPGRNTIWGIPVRFA